MADAQVVLKARDGSTSEAEATVVRYSTSARALRFGVSAACGLVIGLLTLPVPGLHLFAPWFIPLLGIGIGLYLTRVQARLQHIGGPCPRCGAQVEEGSLGAVGPDPLWVRCPGCGAPLEVQLPE